MSSGNHTSDKNANKMKNLIWWETHYAKEAWPLKSRNYISDAITFCSGFIFLSMETDRRKEHLENGKVQDSQTELEDALYLTGSGKFHTFLLLSCGIGLAGVMMETFGTSFLLPSAQCDFNLTSTDKSLLNGLYPVGMICGSHLWGYLADTRGRKKILICAFLLDAACAILSSFSHALWLFLIFRFLCGFLIVAASSVIYAYFGEFHSPETRNKGLMWLSIFIGLGIGLQPGIAWLIIPQNWEWHLPWLIYKPWRLFIVACAVPNLVSGLILIFWLPETPKFLMSLGKKEEALKVLKNMYARNSGNSGEKYPVKSVILIEDGATQIPMSASGSPIINLIVHMWNQTAPLFKPPFLWKTLLACFVQYGLYASANGLSLWLPDIFNHEAAYYASYPDSHPSICQIFTPNQLLMHSENITQSNDNFSLDFNQITSMNLHQNDTLTFNCENNTLVLSVNNSTEIMINPITNILKCQNDTIVNNLTDKSLQFDFQDGKVILTFLNVSVANHELQNDTKSSASEQLKHNDMECNSDVDLSAFQNTLIIGLASCIAYTCVGFLIGPLGKKTIIVCSLLSGGVAGLLLDYVNANWEFSAMALAFVTLSGMCITVMVSAVVEIFPTNLRAMAVCLSLMTGRMGSFTAHMLMGVLLENHCVVMTYILGGLCTCCGLLAFLLPSPKKND